MESRPSALRLGIIGSGGSDMLKSEDWAAGIVEEEDVDAAAAVAAAAAAASAAELAGVTAIVERVVAATRSSSD